MAEPVQANREMYASSRSSLPFDPARALALAMKALEIEAQAVLGLKARQGESFTRAVETLLHCTGRVVMVGMGKSGHVARKLASTLASTGTPAMFVHPGEASHGDIGMIVDGDVVMLISNSGEVDEIVNIMPALKRLRIPLIVMTGRPESTLATQADIVLDSGVNREACPLNLAPTASTTAQMALGDAIAIALLDARSFCQEDFARLHPGGSLGRRLLTRVRDIMRSGVELPLVRADTGFGDLMRVMSQKCMGAAVVVDDCNHVLGVFTDGDLRRCLEEGRDLRGATARELMDTDPKSVPPETLASDAACLMEECHTTVVLVVDAAGGQLLGAINSHDLVRAKVMCPMKVIE